MMTFRLEREFQNPGALYFRPPTKIIPAEEFFAREDCRAQPMAKNTVEANLSFR